jgi:hypothetical protein
MSLFKFLEYIARIGNQDILLANKFLGKDKEFHYTTWVKLSEWKQKYPAIEPNYRQILSNEIVLEKDYPNKEDNKKEAEKIIEVLKEKNINFWCVFTGSKSYHIHIICDDLKLLEEDLRPLAKKNISKELLGEELYKGIDEANFGNKRLIQIEIVVNPKTGVKAVPFGELTTGKQPVIPELVSEERTIKLKRKMVGEFNWRRNLVPAVCPALELFFKKEIKANSTNLARHEWIAPSMAGYIRFKSNRDELAKQYYIAQNKPVGELESWDKKQTYFSCNRVRKYMADNGMENICAKCLLEGGKE